MRRSDPLIAKPNCYRFASVSLMQPPVISRQETRICALFCALLGGIGISVGWL